MPFLTRSAAVCRANLGGGTATVEGTPALFAVARQNFWLDSRFGRSLTGSTLTAWEDQFAGLDFDSTTADGGATALVSPTLSSVTLNGRLGIQLGASNAVGLASTDAAIDNLWQGTGIKALFFAFRATALPASGEAVVIEKERTNNLGWTLSYNQAGALLFTYETSSTVSLFVGVSANVTVGKDIVGWFEWDGVGTSVANARFRLWDATAQAWQYPTIFTGAGSAGIASDAASELYIGRARVSTGGFLKPHVGLLWALGMVEDFANQQGLTGQQILESYLQAYTNRPDLASVEPTALVYGSKLKFYLSSTADVAHVGATMSSWKDQVGPYTFTPPGGGSTIPSYAEADQNGLPGIVYTGLDDRLYVDPVALDGLWSGAGIKRVHFAARIEQLGTDFANSTPLIEKSFYGTGAGKQGWVLQVTTGGDLELRHNSATDNSFIIALNTNYAVGELVLGSIAWDGDVTSSANVSARLWNNATEKFEAVAATVTTLAAQTLGTDTSFGVVVGNNADTATNASSFNANWEGSIFELWFTNPGDRSFDDQILRRWVP